MCYLSAHYATLMSENKHFLAMSQDRAFGWSNISKHELLFQWDCIMIIQRSVLV